MAGFRTFGYPGESCVSTHRHRLVAASGKIQRPAAAIKVMRAVIIPGILVFFAVLLRTPVLNALLFGLIQLSARGLLMAAALEAKRERCDKGQGYGARPFHALLLCAALFEFLSAAAGTWIVAAGLRRFTDNRLDRQRLSAHKEPCTVFLAERGPLAIILPGPLL